MNTPVCQTCVHYRRHYVLDDQSCIPVDCGHCTYPRIKHREPGCRACGNYELRTVPPALPDRESVVHFLTKDLLQYILSLRLPPEAKDGG